MNKVQRFLFETRIGDRLLGLLEKHIGLTVDVAKPTSAAISFSFGFAASRPLDGQQIDVKHLSGDWESATYYDDGINGIVVDENSVTEIEEYPYMSWRPIEWRPNALPSPKPRPTRR